MSDKRQWTASTRIGQALLCLMVVVLSRCSNTSTVEGRLKDYADRVQRVTGISISESHSNGPDLLHYPRRRDRLWSKKESNIGLLDFVALADCELQQLVGQRNSGLGAVMPVSQRLLYEHRFIASAPRCIGQLEIGSRRSRALAMPPQFLEYYQRQLHMEHQSGLWTRFERSILHHASSWQALLDECGLPIGTDS